MRAYRVKYGAHVKFAGSSADATAAKHEINERCGFGPRSRNVTIEQIEIPTGKDSLLAFLNGEADAIRLEVAKL